MRVRNKRNPYSVSRSRIEKARTKIVTNDDFFWLASCRALFQSPAHCSCGSVVVGEPASRHSPPAAAAPPPWWGGRETPPPPRPRPPGCPCPSGPLLCRHPHVLEEVRIISLEQRKHNKLGIPMWQLNLHCNVLTWKMLIISGSIVGQLTFYTAGFRLFIHTRDFFFYNKTF